MMTQDTQKPAMFRPLKRGDKVLVYHKPFTNECPEERAILRQHISGDRWLVQFPPDPADQLYERIVLSQNREKTQ